MLYILFQDNYTRPTEVRIMLISEAFPSMSLETHLFVRNLMKFYRLLCASHSQNPIKLTVNLSELVLLTVRLLSYYFISENINSQLLPREKI